MKPVRSTPQDVSDALRSGELFADGDAVQLGGGDCIERVVLQREDERGGGVGEVERHYDRILALYGNVVKVFQARML